ncbi:hypothetical protein FO519_001870 [Halicephalobus sp. NKZ332]|nr:hypothetical protein FO519_001870 [Halicephalobus sp. NKZ332]
MTINKKTEFGSEQFLDEGPGIALFWVLAIDPTLVKVTPCAYPVFMERHACGVEDRHLLNGLFCDPDSTVSMSEIQLVNDVLEREYQRHEGKCICPGMRARHNNHCWYKFGFAFLKEMWPVEGALTNHHSGEHCPLNVTNADVLKNTKIFSPEDVSDYGSNFVKVLRERWNFGSCGEEVLFLILQKRPDQLSKNKFNPRPFIFISYGSTVVEKLSSVLVPYSLGESTTDPLRMFVDEENDNLDNGYPLNRVLIDLIMKISDSLNKSEHHQRMPLHKDHIPFWAWMVFAACGVLCIFMGIGLCLIRTTTRRGSQRGKQSVDPGRRWKAGFVGGMWFEL